MEQKAYSSLLRETTSIDEAVSDLYDQLAFLNEGVLNEREEGLDFTREEEFTPNNLFPADYMEYARDKISDFLKNEIGVKLESSLQFDYLQRFLAYLIYSVYRGPLLKRKDKKFTISHHLFMLKYLIERGITGFEYMMGTLGHDYLEDTSHMTIRKIEEEISLNFIDRERKIFPESRRLLSLYKKKSLTHDMIKNGIQRNLAEKTSEGIAALSRIRLEDYRDYIDSIVFYIGIKEKFGPDLAKLDERIDQSFIKKDYLQSGILSFIAQNINYRTDYKILAIKVADRIHNTLTLEGFDREPVEKTLLELEEKSLYLIYVSKLFIQYGVLSIVKEMQSSQPKKGSMLKTKIPEVQDLRKSKKTMEEFKNELENISELAKQSTSLYDKTNFINSISSLKLLYREFSDLSIVSYYEALRLNTRLGEERVPAKTASRLNLLINSIGRMYKESGYFCQELFNSANRTRAVIEDEYLKYKLE